MLVAGALLGMAGVPVGQAAEGDAPMDHSQHAGHQMSHEQIEILKSKIELYRPYTDEQINAAMSRMYEAQEYLSPPDVRGEIGILGLGHGYKEVGDALFKKGYAGVAAVYPTAVGLGMTMMSSAHIQKSVDELEAAGARTIVVLPTEIGDNTSLIRQWDYAFGRTDTSSYLDVERIRSKARIVLARTPTTSPLLTEILVDYVRNISKDPAKETLVLIAHGPEDPNDNSKELANLAVHAAGDVQYGTLQDDAPPAIRQQNVDRMRGWIKAATDAGHRVIVVPVLIVSGSGVSGRIERDLAGLDYINVDKGIAEHPLFDRWIRDTVAAAL